MYIMVIDDAGQTVERKYVEPTRLSDWLLHHGPEVARCEVFTEAPERGGSRIAILRRYEEERQRA